MAMCIRKMQGLVAFLALIILTALSLYKKTVPGLPSYCLKTQETNNGITRRIDYLDSDGKITFATDKHYATLIETYEDGHLIQEKYLDAEGKPAFQTQGHCGLKKSYNTDDLPDVITYLDEEEKPVITTYGYSTIHRTYNDLRLAEIDAYYIGDKQVQHKNGYYYLHREYDLRKRVREISYLDQDGELTLHKNGYSIITRTYNKDGRIEYEYYLDKNNAPVEVLSGYYGIYREYDEYGNATLTVFLNPSGQPMDNSSGYSKIEKTYMDKGTVASVHYFNSEGVSIFRFDTFLNEYPFLVLAAGVIMLAMAICLKGKGSIAFLIVYIMIVGVMTIGYRETGEPRSKLELFWSYRQFFASDSIRREIINNIWLFVPLGAWLSHFNHRYGWMWAIGLSAIIEIIQYITGIGLCELDDMISNSIGAMIGHSLAKENVILYDILFSDHKKILQLK